MRPSRTSLTACIQQNSHGILRGEPRTLCHRTCENPQSTCSTFDIWPIRRAERAFSRVERDCAELWIVQVTRRVAMADTTRAPRGSNFSSGELNQLVASWLHVSQDPIVGSCQKLGAFWDRTMKHYNDHKPQDRETRAVRSLETKWSDVKRDVAKFAGCYQNVVDQHISGLSLEEILQKSKELYVIKDPKGKEFQYIDQWYLLKDCQRFAMSVDDMAQKAAQKKARKQKGKGRNVNSDKENETPNQGGMIDLGDDQADGQQPGNVSSNESLHFGEERPLGNKQAKKLRADESATKIIAAAQRDMVALSAKRLRLAEKLDEKQDRDRLLYSRIDDIDEECQPYFRLCRAKELRIAMLKLQREEEEATRAFRSTIRSPLPMANPPVNATVASPAEGLDEDDDDTQSGEAYANLNQDSPSRWNTVLM